MKNIRYESMKIDRVLTKEYANEMEQTLKNIDGLNDIEKLLHDFEEKFASYIGTKYAIALNSGSDALQLAICILGIGKGDSVIIPNVTYPAVPLGVIYNGAEPIFIDSREEDFQINEKLIEKSIKNNTKAIIAAHMFGLPNKIDVILSIAKKYNLYVIEDVCQAESSVYQGKKLGSYGDISCFSFSYYKPLSSCGGGGGMVCFNDARYKKILDYTKIWNDDEVLLNIKKRYARMYLLDLVTIRVKFKYLKQIIKSRLEAKTVYEKCLGKIKNIKILEHTNKENIHVMQNFPIIVPKEEKKSLGDYLLKNGVLWQEPYCPLNMMNIFKEYTKDKFPVSSQYYYQTIHLPLYSFIKVEDVEYISSLISEYYNKMC